MALELLIAEAQGLSEDALMEAVRFLRFLKTENGRMAAPVPEAQKPVIRRAGKYRGQIALAEDFDAPLDEFKEYI